MLGIIERRATSQGRMEVAWIFLSSSVPILFLLVAHIVGACYSINNASFMFTVANSKLEIPHFHFLFIQSHPLISMDQNYKVRNLRAILSSVIS